MRKKSILLFGVILLITGLLFTFGFQEKDSLNLRIDVNKESYLRMLDEKDPLVSQNSNKFGNKLENSFINLKVNNFEELESNENVKNSKATATGVVHTPDGNYNFESSGTVEEVTLKSGKKLLNGGFSGTVKNKKDNEVFNLSLLYDLNTEEVFVSITSGYVDDTAALPFGRSFVSKEEMYEMYELILGEEVSNNEK